MLIAVASGKGGTGKTTIAVNLAMVLSETNSVCLVDADAEQPNAHLLLKDLEYEASDVVVPMPVIDNDLCSGCGECVQVCAHNALALVGGKVMVFSDLCHSCGGCVLLCPEGAIVERERTIGTVRRGVAEFEFIQGELNVTQMLVQSVIRAAKQAIGQQLAIIDCPPGSSCAMVEAIRGVDYCLLVTEPTPFGLHDLQLAHEAVRSYQIPSGVVVNRCDIGDDAVLKYCQASGLSVVAELPYDLNVARAGSRGKLAIEVSKEWNDRFSDLARIAVAGKGGLK